MTELDPPSGERLAAERDAAFAEYRRTGDRRLRNRLVEENRGVAEYFIKRYTHRGVPVDDLRQISLLAVISAVDRFDPSLGVAFSTFASRTIEGELKRYLRDRTWMVRPPRRAQELHLELRRADEDLSQQLGRSPTIAELAAAVDATEDHVLEALEAGVAHQATSLDQPQAGAADEDTRSVGDRVLVGREAGFEDVERAQVIGELLADLPEREREVIRLRFFENMTQPEIARADGRQPVLSVEDHPPHPGGPAGPTHRVRRARLTPSIAGHRRHHGDEQRTVNLGAAPRLLAVTCTRARGGGLEPPISGPEPLVLPITPPPKVVEPRNGAPHSSDSVPGRGNASGATATCSQDAREAAVADQAPERDRRGLPGVLVGRRGLVVGRDVSRQAELAGDLVDAVGVVGIRHQ